MAAKRSKTLPKKLDLENYTTISRRRDFQSRHAVPFLDNLHRALSTFF